MSERIEYLYLTTTGRVTGKRHEIEIWFVESEGKYYVLAEHRHMAQWVRNIAKNPRVHIRVGSSVFDGTARALDELADREAYELAQQLMRDKYDWGDGLPIEIVPRP